MQTSDDYYSVLGVPKSATDQEIKAAYRKKAKEYHPDVSIRLDASEMFRLLNEAYSVLKDKKKREAYNISLMADIFDKQVMKPAKKRFSGFGYTSEVAEDDWGWRVG